MASRHRHGQRVVGYSITMTLCRLHRKGAQGQLRAKNDTTDSLAYHAACPMQDTDLPMDLIQMRGPPSVKALLCCAPHPCASWSVRAWHVLAGLREVTQYPPLDRTLCSIVPSWPASFPTASWQIGTGLIPGSPSARRTMGPVKVPA